MSKTFYYDDTLGFVCRTLRYGNAPTIIESTIGQLNSDSAVNKANANTSNALNELDCIEERKKGKWEDNTKDGGWKCSECGFISYSVGFYKRYKTKYRMRFCPNCGTDMRRKADD